MPEQTALAGPGLAGDARLHVPPSATGEVANSTRSVAMAVRPTKRRAPFDDLVERPAVLLLPRPRRLPQELRRLGLESRPQVVEHLRAPRLESRDRPVSASQRAVYVRTLPGSASVTRVLSDASRAALTAAFGSSENTSL